MKELSIVIAVYNEELNVKILTEKVDDALKSHNYELIFVDDGSTDKTVKNIKNINNENVVLVELKRNFGQSSAIAAGIDIATGEYIVTLDGDLQNDPTDIPMMLEKAKKEDWDLVAGIRKNRKDNFIRNIPSKIANFIIRSTTKLYVKDYGCALKVFKNEIAKNLNIYGELHRFIPLLAHLDGASITQVNVKHHSRKYGKSKYGINRTLRVMSDLILIIFFKKYIQRPIHLFGNIGIILFLIGAAINFYLLILKIGGQDIWGKPLLLLGILLVLAGIQLITTGIIAEILIRTYFESQAKKPYTIKKITLSENKAK